MQTETSTNVVNAIVERIAEAFLPEQIVLFGSHVHGSARVDSDLDLLVVMHSDQPRHKRAAPIRLLFRNAPYPLDILVLTPDEVLKWNGTVNHIITEALATGKVVYERH